MGPTRGGEVPEDLQLTIDESAGSYVVLSVEGELDVSTAPQLREALMSVVARLYGTVILDLSGVGFIDSSALGVILSAWKQIKAQDGSMAIASPTPRITRIFEITGLTLSFPVCPSVPEALAAAGPQPEPPSTDGAITGG
jgi:anti-sigma B factor antagonist